MIPVRKMWRNATCLATIPALFLAGVAAAGSYKFDMGGENTPLASSYVSVTPATTLDKNPDFGWLQPARWVIFRGGPTNPYYSRADTAWEYPLYSDGVLSMKENTFEFTVEPGSYVVTAVIGDLEPHEDRPGNYIWANGVDVAKNELTDGTVKAFRFPVDAASGKISLRFRAESFQKYVTVVAVTAEPLALDKACELAVTEYPAKRPQPEDYRRNWKHHESLFIADWGKAKEELKAENIDLKSWAKASVRLRKQRRYREYIPFGIGHWQRIDKMARGISIERSCKAFLEMGIDGFVATDRVAFREFPKYGLKYALYAGGEHFPRMDVTVLTPNLMKDVDGSTSTKSKVWSNCDPKATDAFRTYYRETRAPAAGGATFFMIDEPRGQWFAGGKFGDYSKPAQITFRAWAAEHGWKHLAGQGIPERGRTMDFYRFYLFRLETPAMFVKACIKDMPLENLETVPGNGNVGPELMNHSCYWPPAMARNGFVSTSWAYDSPASCKMYAETVRIAEEHGGKSYITPPLSVYKHDTPFGAISMATACISALNTKICPYSFKKVKYGLNRPAWMKTVYYQSRLTHATTGFVHVPSIYIWCPESIVYNDLVEMKMSEANNWKKLTQVLFNANIDYSVTNLLRVPKSSVVLYTCVRPILNKEEFNRLRKFVRSDGTLLVSFKGTPEFPDGKKIAGWDTLPRKHIFRMDLSPSVFKERVRSLVKSKKRNWELDARKVKTYRYIHRRRSVHLLNNTDFKTAATVTVPVKVKDVFTGSIIKADASLVIPPGKYAMLKEL